MGSSTVSEGVAADAGPRYTMDALRCPKAVTVSQLLM